MWLFMFLLFGLRSLRTQVAAVSLTCYYCGARAEQRVIRRTMRLTVFFIPVLPLRTSYLMECSHCGAETGLTPDQAQNSVEWTRTHQPG